MELAYKKQSCTELKEENIGQEATLAGWASTIRDLGGIIFVELRDKTGLFQLVADPQINPEVHKVLSKIKPEYDSEFVFQNTLGTPYEKYIQITSQRSGQPGVNAQEYAEYAFLVPDYAEQKKIGSFLRQIDNLITLHQREQLTANN